MSELFSHKNNSFSSLSSLCILVFSLKFVPLQNKFDEASADGKPEYWLADGVHPTAAGHALIKDALMEALDF